ncbi:MAG: hypothetical protein MUF37_01075 [Methanoregulaceae archaeon]|jgi:hypothetical protein|nr:hypothetical protein [Methanoregulaceae archaeon]
MMPELLILIMVSCTGLFILGLFVTRRIRYIPEVKAWNPNSHDKITSYAIDILGKAELPTLFGWVVKNASLQAGSSQNEYFKKNVWCELRRGSVDEDMSSDLWTKWLEKVGWLVDVLSDPTKEGSVVNEQTFEGTNGAYHFYYWNGNIGLSDKTQLADNIVKPVLGESRDQMPSALDRAVEKGSAEDWFFDKEKRNYTIDNSVSYWELGYYHLTFYSLGRVLHLLQDMAVPAHVRNDSHGNMLDDHPEPLEYYADHMDLEPFGRGRAPNVDRWSYEPNRNYLDHVSFSPNPKIHSQALTTLDTLSKQVFPADNFISGFKALFSDLASLTYSKCYSFGTIPWNMDSHNPANPAESPWCPEDILPEKNTKCQVNTGALCDVLNLLHNEAKILKNTLSIHHLVLPDLKLDSKSSSQAVLEFLNKLEQDIGLINQNWLNYVRMNDPEKNKDDYNKQTPKAKEQFFETGIIYNDFKTRIQYLDINLLREKLRDNPGFKTAMTKWIENYPDKKSLLIVFMHPPNEDFESFKIRVIAGFLPENYLHNSRPVYVDRPHNNDLRTWWRGFHGPYCLVNNNDEVKPRKGLEDEFTGPDNIIAQQYILNQANAIACSALLLKNWFEYYCSRFHRGVGLWINKDAQTPSSAGESGPVDNTVQQVIENDNKLEPKIPSVFSLGIINHLPIEIDLDVEITLTNIEGVSKEDAKDQALIFSDISKFDFAQGKNEKTESLKELADTELTLDHPVLKFHITKVPPYNSSTLKSQPIPMHGSDDIPEDMGGILWEQEPSKLGKGILSNPGAPFEEQSFESSGNSKIKQPDSVVLRFEFGDDKKNVPGDSS